MDSVIAAALAPKLTEGPSVELMKKSGWTQGQGVKKYEEGRVEIVLAAKDDMIVMSTLCCLA